jgi:hypothetical protein
MSASACRVFETAMRHLATFAVVLSLAGSPAAAGAQELEFGAKAGPSFSTLAFEPRESGDYDRRISAAFGGFLILPLTAHVSVQLEALVMPKGAKLYDAESNMTGAVLLQYFEVPALVRVAAPRSSLGRVHVAAGPYAGVRFSARRQLSVAFRGITSGSREDMSREVERYELGLAVGGGLDIGRHLLADARYSHALTGLNTDRSDGLRIRNRALTFMVGFRF